MKIHLFIRCLVIGALALQGRVAFAERFAIESYVVKRPADAERVMLGMREALERHRFIAKPEALVKLIGDHAARPAIMDPRFTAQELAKRVDLGTNQYIDLNYDAAAKTLENVLELARNNLILVAKEPKNRDVVLHGMLYLALARGRQVDDANKSDVKRRELAASRDAIMAEMIRSFPNKVITSRDFGHEAEQLFDRVHHDNEKTGRGQLAISVSDPGAVIYVDETVRAQGKVNIGDLVPGPYRVLIQAPNGDSRVYDTTVMASEETRLRIDWDVDSMLVTRDWVGFRYPSDKEHAREAELVRRLARQTTTAIMVAVITIGRTNGHATVTATLYGVETGKLVRSGMVELSGSDDAARIDEIVAFLEGTPEPHVTAVTHPEYTAPPTDAPEADDKPKVVATPPSIPTKHPVASIDQPAASPTGSDDRPNNGWVKWALGGVGVAAIGAGAYLVAISNNGTCGKPADQCPEIYGTAKYGWPTIGGGVTLIGVATYLFFHDRSSHHVSVAAAPTRDGFVASAQWRFW